MVNAGLAEDAAMLEATGADGIGLFRTEFQFLIAATLPGRESQLRLYKSVLEAAGDKPVVFRTVDIGGDKALPYLSEDAEGRERESGDGLARAAPQPRAQGADEGAGAGADRGVGRQDRCASCSRWSASRGNMRKRAPCSKSRSPGPRAPSAAGPKAVEFGAMLEVPSLAEMLDLLLPRVDFLSIGTNDLTQFLFAADRADPRLAERYDWLSPAILRFLRRVAAEAKAADVPVRVCGEMAGRPLEAMALIGIGIDSFSITPAAVGPVKAMVRSIDAAAVRTKVESLLAKPPGQHAQIAYRLGQAAWRGDRLIFHLVARLTGGASAPDNGPNFKRMALQGRAMDETEMDDVVMTVGQRLREAREAKGTVGRGYRRPDSYSDPSSDQPGKERLGQAPGRDLFDRLRQKLCRDGRARPDRNQRTSCGPKWAAASRPRCIPKSMKRSTRPGQCPRGWCSARLACW